MPIKVVKESRGTVAEVMTAVVAIVDESSSVGEAADTLADLDVTGAPVVSGERIVGVVSRRDVITATDRSRPVSEVMTRTVYAVRPEDPLLLAVRLMVERSIHRVIVVNDDGELQGILSSLDVLGVLAAQAGSVAELEFVDLRGKDG